MTHPSDDDLQRAAEGLVLPAGVAAHVESCPECRGTRDAHVRLSRALSAMPRVEAPPDLADAVLAAWAGEREAAVGVPAGRPAARALGAPRPLPSHDPESLRPARLLGWIVGIDVAVAALVAAAVLFAPDAVGSWTVAAVSAVLAVPALVGAGLTVVSAIGAWALVAAAAVVLVSSIGLRVTLAPVSSTP